KPKAARVAGGKPCGRGVCGVGLLGGGVCFLVGFENRIFECQAESSKIVRSEQPFFTIFRTPQITGHTVSEDKHPI
ncbi:MAG: hypothetical protein P8Y30_08550, partial [candidate division WOR-3 bacterium]